MYIKTKLPGGWLKKEQGVLLVRRWRFEEYLAWPGVGGVRLLASWNRLA